MISLSTHKLKTCDKKNKNKKNKKIKTRKPRDIIFGNCSIFSVQEKLMAFDLIILLIPLFPLNIISRIFGCIKSTHS